MAECILVASPETKGPAILHLQLPTRGINDLPVFWIGPRRVIAYDLETGAIHILWTSPHPVYCAQADPVDGTIWFIARELEHEVPGLEGGGAMFTLWQAKKGSEPDRRLPNRLGAARGNMLFAHHPSSTVGVFWAEKAVSPWEAGGACGEIRPVVSPRGSPENSHSRARLIALDTRVRHTNLSFETYDVPVDTIRASDGLDDSRVSVFNALSGEVTPIGPRSNGPCFALAWMNESTLAFDTLLSLGSTRILVYEVVVEDRVRSRPKLDIPLGMVVVHRLGYDPSSNIIGAACGGPGDKIAMQLFDAASGKPIREIPEVIDVLFLEQSRKWLMVHSVGDCDLELRVWDSSLRHYETLLTARGRLVHPLVSQAAGKWAYAAILEGFCDGPVKLLAIDARTLSHKLVELNNFALQGIVVTN